MRSHQHRHVTTAWRQPAHIPLDNPRVIGIISWRTLHDPRVNEAQHKNGEKFARLFWVSIKKYFLMLQLSVTIYFSSNTLCRCAKYCIFYVFLGFRSQQGSFTMSRTCPVFWYSIIVIQPRISQRHDVGYKWCSRQQKGAKNHLPTSTYLSPRNTFPFVTVSPEKHTTLNGTRK